jgi:hypothetical protein
VVEVTDKRMELLAKKKNDSITESMPKPKFQMRFVNFGQRIMAKLKNGPHRKSSDSTVSNATTSSHDSGIGMTISQKSSITLSNVDDPGDFNDDLQKELTSAKVLYMSYGDVMTWLCNDFCSRDMDQPEKIITSLWP